MKYFLKEDGDYLIEEMPLGDVWGDVPDGMHLKKIEKTGYPTQKPEALLTRIISAASNEGDAVLDAFSGSGTTAVAAQRLGRRWIAIDSGRLAVKTTVKRLLNLPASVRAPGSENNRAAFPAPFTVYRAVKP